MQSSPTSSNPKDKKRKKVKRAFFFFTAPLGLLSAERLQWTTSYDLVSDEETSVAFVYKMDRPLLRSDNARVEIRGGQALWVISPGEETIKVKLQKNHKMRVSEATASMSTDGVLTVVIPKRHRRRKWYEYKELALDMFKTVHVGISWPY